MIDINASKMFEIFNNNTCTISVGLLLKTVTACLYPCTRLPWRGMFSAVPMYGTCTHVRISVSFSLFSDAPLSLLM